MLSINDLLVARDFSSVSNRAVRNALHLAARTRPPCMFSSLRSCTRPIPMGAEKTLRPEIWNRFGRN